MVESGKSFDYVEEVMLEAKQHQLTLFQRNLRLKALERAVKRVKEQNEDFKEVGEGGVGVRNASIGRVGGIVRDVEGEESWGEERDEKWRERRREERSGGEEEGEVGECSKFKRRR